jgi:DNA-binding GntR family transcriptional regulator
VQLAPIVDTVAHLSDSDRNTTSGLHSVYDVPVSITNAPEASEALNESPGPRKSIERSLLSQQIANHIRRDILRGVIKPDTRLSQQQLCEEFGTSRMPVRDALRVLAHEGLLITDSARHTIVAPMSRQDLLDAYLVEGILSGVAAQRASEVATPEDVAKLIEMHQLVVGATKAKDKSRTADLNWNLHRTINRLAGSRKILAAIKQVSLDLPRNLLIESPEWNEKSNREHDQILERMAAKDHEAVNRLMTEHVVTSGQSLIDYLEEQGLILQ